MSEQLSISTTAILPNVAEEAAATASACVHCGLDCPPNPPKLGERVFCCAGCRMAYQILSDNGLERFYDIEAAPGARPPQFNDETYAALNLPDVRRRIVDFSNGKVSRVTFRIPSIHCAACVWLLENLYRLIPGVGRSEVNFPRKEVTIFVEDQLVQLSDVASRLATLGYAPELKLDRLSTVTKSTGKHRLLMQIGVAGFAFGNVMLMSFPSYLGLNPATEASLQRFFGLASLLMSIPVLLFSAQDYFRNAWNGIRQRMLTIDFPLALGISALFLQSTADVLRHTGEGYFDSFTGLVFLLLCGRWLQRNTYDAIAFDRDYKSYFPLAVIRRHAGAEETVALNELKPGDRVIIRHGELVPADAVIINGQAELDYSFVTGESEPAHAATGDYVYAGARQTGDTLEIELVKDVSQSYLTSLWNNDAFRKPREYELENLTNTAGRWFTVAVIAVAAGTALYWSQVDPAQIARTFASVLIVACPCALALAAPFTFGSAQRILGKAGLFLRSPSVIEAIARANVTVFDKTGTLTVGARGSLAYEGISMPVAEKSLIASLARRSIHPISRLIAGQEAQNDLPVSSFESVDGCGIRGIVDGHAVALGKGSWLGVSPASDKGGTWVSIDGTVRGRYKIEQIERPGLQLIARHMAAQGFDLALLSGDRDESRSRFESVFGRDADLRFNQSPHDKLAYIRDLQSRGERILMIGDGLNDAGALRQSDVGVAVSEDISLFSPASDAVLDARAFLLLPKFTRFAQTSLNVLKSAFGISLLYNAVGISFAASGALSPLVSAILMPLSSLSVILFTVLATSWSAKRTGVTA